MTLASQWLGDPLNRTHTVTPLLDWTLKLQKEVIYPLGIATAEALPWTKVLFAEWFPLFQKFIHRNYCYYYEQFISVKKSVIFIVRIIIIDMINHNISIIFFRM